TVNSIFKGGRLLLVNKENKIIGESTERARIPVDGYIIYGPQDKLKDLKIGDIVDFSYSIQGEDLEKINFILGAGPKLIENKQEINNISKESFSCASICREARRS